MVDSINTQIADKLVQRQFQALRVEGGLRQEVFAQLALLESEILSALKSHDPTEWALLVRRRQAIQELMAKEIDPLITERYQHIADLLDTAMLRLAIHEAATVGEIINTETDEQIVEEAPSRRQLRAGVVRGLFPSPTGPTDFSTFAADWWQRQGASLQQRIGDSLMVGISLEENITDLTRRIRGTSDSAFTDGIMGKARQDAQRLVATQTTNALTEARMAVGDTNAEGLIAIHTSILDSRTSVVCLSRNGLKYSLPDHEPIGHTVPYLNGPPYHPNCRSIITIALSDGGAVAQETTTQWLKRQSTAVQDEVLGPTRAQMFRNGRLSPRQLLDSVSGRPLTLEELGA